MRVGKLSTAFLGLVAVAIVGLGLGGSSAVADLQSGSVNVMPVVFRDSSGKTAVAIQLVPRRPDTGRFVFRIYGTATVIGVVPLHISAQECDFDSSITGTFYDEAGSQPSGVPVRITGRIDRAHHGVTVSLTTSTATYQVVIPSSAPADPTVAAQGALQALKNEDWTAMFGVLASDVKSGYTASMFAQQMVGQAAPHIVSFSITGPASQRQIGGYLYSIVPYTAKLRAADGTLSTINESVYLVLEGTNWHYMTTGPTPYS